MEPSVRYWQGFDKYIPQFPQVHHRPVWEETALAETKRKRTNWVAWCVFRRFPVDKERQYLTKSFRSCIQKTLHLRVRAPLYFAPPRGKNSAKFQSDFLFLYFDNNCILSSYSFIYHERQGEKVQLVWPVQEFEWFTSGQYWTCRWHPSNDWLIGFGSNQVSWPKSVATNRKIQLIQLVCKVHYLHNQGTHTECIDETVPSRR